MCTCCTQSVKGYNKMSVYVFVQLFQEEGDREMGETDGGERARARKRDYCVIISGRSKAGNYT